MSEQTGHAGEPTVPPNENPSGPGATRDAGPGATHAHFEDPVLLEEDETVPPRPEEEVADVLRAEPDPH
ncbi:hypothetical protein [Georgenia yuyongxinii]|uniref:Uncharacterized protein n=1 Tax=Georgenia yuyongxinii TaxID=2589797 RepID=A0A552WPM1_9MICO|nr:hypothetical protein [Georgenia yuyongxinii]TRW44716.1 hypothetical protein FJ693_12455 [Georgenia yuyongxinii]